MTTPDKDKVESLVDDFARISRSHMFRARETAPDGKFTAELRDKAIDEVIAAIAAYAAMSVSKVPTEKVRRLDDFNATFRNQLAAEIVSSFQPFTL